jgi:hypothetical protein
MVNINEFIVKPVPKKIEDVILNIKNEDLREEKRINREEVLVRLERLMKGLRVEPLKIDKSEEESKEDKYKDDDDDETNKQKKEKRLTKKQTTIQESIRSITFSEETSPSKKKSRSQKIVHKVPQSLTEIRENLKKLLKEEEEEDREFTCDNYERQIQQKVVTEYLKLHTPYRGLLLYHGIGSGKTCTAIVAAEGLKSEKKILVMTPESLKTNFVNEIKKCGDESFRTDQRWTHKKVSERHEAEELSKVVSLDTDTILEKGVWFGAEDDGVKFAEMSVADQEEVNKQIDKMLRAKYKNIAYDKLSEELMKKLTENETKNPFDNSVVIIDEVHNFVRQIAKDNDSVSTRLYHYLMAAQRCKLVFLSGTPIVESPHEIAIIFNMLHGYIRKWTVPLIGDKRPSIEGVEYKDNKAIITQNAYMQYEEIDLKETLKSLNADRDPTLTNFKILPDEEGSFNKRFIEKDKMTSRDAFQRRILGLTSYFKGAPEELLPKYDRNRDFVIIRVPMSEYQTKEYKKALEKDDADKKFSRQACNYVDTGEEKDLNKDALLTFSPKCLQLLENIQDEEGLHMVYSELSCEIIREILLANGFDEFKLVKGVGGVWDVDESEATESEATESEATESEATKKPKFVLFSAIKDEDEKETMLNIYNHNWTNLNPVLQEKLERMSKSHKEIIKVFMISETDAEGISLKNTRFVHIVEPSVNATRIEQVIGRVRRICSHVGLPEEQRNVKTYLYISTLDGNGDKSTDELIFETANEKDHLNQEVLRAVKETAIDCSLYEKDAICYKLGGTQELKSNMIIGGKRYNRDKDNNIYDVNSEKPFGKLVREENEWAIH